MEVNPLRFAGRFDFFAHEIGKIRRLGEVTWKWALL